MSSLLELLKAKKQDLNAGNRRKTIKCADGTGRYRILPSWRGEGQQFWHDFGQHFVKDASKKISAIYLCTEKTFGKPCSICAAIAQGIKAASDDFTIDLLKEANAGGRILVNALHVDGPNPTEVQILELAPSSFAAVLAIAAEWEEAGESVFDTAPGKGKDILITRTGTGLQTKYTAQVAAKVTPLPAGVLTKLHNLDEYVAQESNEQQLRALNAVRSVSGLLAGPATGGLPALGAAPIAEDPYAVAAPPVKRVAAPVAPAEAFDDVPEFAEVPVAAPVKPAKPVAAVTAAATAAIAAAVAATGDSDLDDLLNSLG